MHHFAPAEPEGQLDLVSFFEEAAHVPHLDIVIVTVDARPHLDLFDLDDLLPLAGLVLLLLRLVLEAAEVEDLAHRRIAVAGHLDEVPSAIPRRAHRTHTAPHPHLPPPRPPPAHRPRPHP